MERQNPAFRPGAECRRPVCRRPVWWPPGQATPTPGAGDLPPSRRNRPSRGAARSLVGEAGRLVVCPQPLQMFEVFAASFAWWGDDQAVGLRREALRAGVGKDLQVNGVGEQVDQAGVTCLGDVSDGSGPDLAAEQWPSALISDDEGFHGVDAALAGDRPAASAAVCARATDPDLGGVHQCRHPRCGSRGRRVEAGSRRPHG